MRYIIIDSRSLQKRDASKTTTRGLLQSWRWWREREKEREGSKEVCTVVFRLLEWEEMRRWDQLMIHRLNSFVLILQFILNAFSSSSLISSPASIVMIEFVRREDRLTSSVEKWGDITRYTGVNSKRWRSNTRKGRSHHHQENTWSGSYRLIITSDDDDRKELFATLEGEREKDRSRGESQVINFKAMNFCFCAFSLSKTSLVYDWNHVNHEKWLSCQVTEK